MKNRTSTILVKICNSVRIPSFAVLLCSLAALNTAFATDSLLNSLTGYGESTCETDFAETWIVTQSCDLGTVADVKVNDAINIHCDSNTNRWTIELYLEPSAGEPGNAVAYNICPGNGYVVKTGEGQTALHCQYWQADINKVKRLEFELQPVTDPNIRHMDWLVRDMDDPNVVCGIAGRPEDDQAKGTSTTVGN